MPLKGIARWTGRLIFCALLASALVAPVLFVIVVAAAYLIETLGIIPSDDFGVSVVGCIVMWAFAAILAALFFGRNVRFHVFFLHGLALLAFCCWLTERTISRLDYLGASGYSAAADFHLYRFEASRHYDAWCMGMPLILTFIIFVGEILLLVALLVDPLRNRRSTREK